MLLRFVQNFFQGYLVTQRGLSTNTVLAYRETLKLCLESVSRDSGKGATDLSLDDLTAKSVLAFLSHIEDGRGNRANTRNQRLAALRTFFRYLAGQDPSRAGQFQAVVMIPLKRAPKRMMDYLDVAELDAVLKCVDRSSELGKRDYVLLNLLYNTGARVQEIVDLRVTDLRLSSPATVTVTGNVIPGLKRPHFPRWCSRRVKAHWRGRGSHFTAVSKFCSRS